MMPGFLCKITPAGRKMFMLKYRTNSGEHSKPSTQRGYQDVIDRNIIPVLGRLKMQGVKHPDVAALLKKLAHRSAEANRTFGILRKMFNLTEVWELCPNGTNRAATSRCFRPARKPGSS
jgi:hypothetical protein